MDLSRYSWPLLYKRLRQLSWSDSQGLTEFETDIYQGIKLNPEVKEYAVFLLQLSLIKGEVEKSVSQAYKVWEAGDPLDLSVKSLYLRQLTALNLYEQARPLHQHLIRAFDRLERSAQQALLNYAIVFDDLKLLSLLSDALTLPEACREAFSNATQRRLLSAVIKLIFTEFAHRIGDFQVDIKSSNILLSVSLNVSSLKDINAAFYAKMQELITASHCNPLDKIQVRLSPLSWHLPLAFTGE